ncbi:MAG: hypothetical protein QW510_04145 [Candidatus Bathyarchaeia archaeon]
MFEGKKTGVFWAGLIVLTLAALILFAWLYYGVTWEGFAPERVKDFVKGSFPFLVGSAVFILIGLYMMKSGTEKLTEKTATITSSTQTITKKRGVYWFGLVISASSALFIFQLLWTAFITGSSVKGVPYYDPVHTLWVGTPFLVGATVFLILGLYMMKSGTR